MKKLIVSYDTYSWVKYCSGMIIQQPNIFSVMIIMREEDKSISGCRGLCKSAVYEQRADDLYNIGMKIGVKELTNFRYTSEAFDIHKLVAQLQIKIMFSNIKEVYYQKCRLLDTVFKEMNKNLNINIYSYDMVGTIGNQIVKLSEEEYDKKYSLKELMIGRHSLFDIADWKDKEIFRGET